MAGFEYARAKIKPSLKDYTMHVKFTDMQEMRFRVWLADKIIKLAVWILGCNLKVTR